MSQPVSYRSTIFACYLSNFIGAIVINLTPILFIPLRELYGLSYTQFGILLATNFITQIVADILFSYPVDRYGIRPFIVLAPILTVIGYAIFGAAPWLGENPFPWFLVGTILFSCTGGLLELLLSPIINGIPGEQKANMMSVLHSFYAWGQMTVVLLTTLLVHWLGRDHWQWIVAAWAVLPLINVIQFIYCPLPPVVPDAERQGAKVLMRCKFFYMIVLTIALGGMTEVSIAMWTSAFLERALELPKLLGDIAGMCLFGAMLGTGRLCYGLFGKKIDVLNVMMIGAGASIVLYLTIALSGSWILVLAACALCGLTVSLLWPGSVSLGAAEFPLAGTWLFAMLAAGGDLGASIGPYLVSLLADNATELPLLSEIAAKTSLTAEQFGLRCGMLLAALFPLGTLLCLWWIRRNRTAPQVERV